MAVYIETLTWNGTEYGVEFDAATEMPVIEPHQFWRVKKDDWGDYTVQLRERLSWWSRLVAEHPCTTLNSERIRAIAATVAIAQQETRTAQQAEARYLGDYPPKAVSL